MPTVAKKQLIDLDQLLAAAQLPALPQTAMTLLELSQDASNGPVEFARPIEADPGLMSQILKFVNSSYFGFSREISSVQQALALVGVRTIKNFALWSAVFSLVPEPKFGPFDLKRLWQDSLRRAVFSRSLGRKLKLPNAEDLFAATLLQDIAIPLLLKELPGQYETLIHRRNAQGLRLSQLEREEFGWDHAQVAAALVRNWKLPHEFAVLIESHPHLDRLLAAKTRPVDAIAVAIASLLPNCQCDAWRDRDAFLSALRQIANLSDDSIIALLKDSDATFADFAPMLRVSIPEISLVQWITRAT
jgi:HD-like signal output (HDOD) protein